MANQIFEGDPEDLQKQNADALLNENPESVDPSQLDPSQQMQDPTQQSQPASPASDPSEALPQNLIDALTSLIDKWEQEEKSYREDKLREWKLLEHYWEGEQNNLWSDVSQDWRPITDWSQEDNLDLEDFQPRTINIYKGHGESVIAALSAGVPGIKFFPDDADKIDDVSTAKVYSRAAELLQRRNNAPLLLVKALYILWNQGTCAAYNYVRNDPRLGTVQVPTYGDIPGTHPVAYCPQCGYDVPVQPEILCEACGYAGPPEFDEVTDTQYGQNGTEEISRITEDIKIYSPLYFTIPNWATDQESIPYIRLDMEQDPGVLITQFKQSIPDVRDKITPTTDSERYQRWSRTFTEYDSKLVTSRQIWIRGWALENIEDDDAREQLLQMFPNGCYVIFAGDEFLTAREESLDDHWTISSNPTSPKLLAKAMGMSVKDIQEMTNELVTMVLDNIEHGTPMTLMDTSLLSLNQFKESKTAPGMVYPVTMPSGGNIGNHVYESRPATLSKEVPEFASSLREYGQFASGAFPSIYGGSVTGGSGTAREYVESRQQALQRLQVTWKTLNSWWTEMMAKSVKDFLNSLTYDEKFVKPQGKDSYINIWIRKKEATGRVGEVLAESSERFPVTWIQKQDALLNLLQLNNQDINTAIFHPENTSLVAQTLGFSDFHIPGDDDRSKQLNEIVELLLGAPQPTMIQGPMGPQQSLASTVPINPDLDNHNLHMETIRAFAISDAGQQTQKENPGGFANMMAHWHEHQQVIQMQQMQQQQAQLQQQMQMEAAKNQGTPDVSPPQGR